MPYREINNETEYIIQCGYERACRQGGIDLKTIQRHGNPRTEEARENDYEE